MIATETRPSTSVRERPRIRRLPHQIRVRPVSVIGHAQADRMERVQRGPSLAVEQPWRDTRPARLRLALLLPLLLFAFSLYQNLSNMDTVDFHRDEARWINRAIFLENLAHPFSKQWTDYYSTEGQPPLGNYVMGLGLLLQGQDLRTNRVWDFHYDQAWNTLVGAMPSHNDLYAGRRTNAVIGALVVVCVYALVSRISNRAGGFAAGLYLSMQPLHLRLSSQALADELLALTLVGAFLLAYRFAQKPTLARGLGLGVLLGLGGATKLSPLLLSLPLAAYGVSWLVWHIKQRGFRALGFHRARFGWMLVVQPAIAFAVFVAVNPFLWPDPIGRTWSLFDFRRTEMRMQAAAWPIASVDSLQEALMRIGWRFGEDYSTFIRTEHYVEQTAFVSLPTLSLDLVLMCAGIVVLAALVIRRGLWSPTALCAFLMASEFGAVIVGMGVDFYRYFLPLLIVLTVCLGVGIGQCWSLITSKRGTHSSAPQPRPPRSRLSGTRGTISRAALTRRTI